MTTWAPSYHHDPLNHPWFAGPTLKRKASNPSSTPSSSSSGSRQSSKSASPPPSKRRKQTALETNFSHLSLQNSELHPSPTQFSASVSAPSLAISAPMNYSEETSIPDVKMKSSTWYEPEPDRIVVTDLDSSDEEAEDGQDESSLQIPPALINKLAAQTWDQLLTESGPNQALVLFKPFPIAGISTSVPATDSKEETKDSPELLDRLEDDDDAMDVEP